MKFLAWFIAKLIASLLGRELPPRPDGQAKTRPADKNDPKQERWRDQMDRANKGSRRE